MKAIPKLFVLCIMLTMFQISNAQVVKSARPYLFNNYGASLPATIAELDKAFLASQGSSIQLQFAGNFSFSGTVSSSVQKYNNLSSVVIESPLLHNSVLAISKRINDDNSITYVGRIINESYADGYELKKDEKGNYAFNKIKTEDLIQDY
ncbi:MAG: hypothetical protein ACRDE8_08355 [Ginsengibacter sp.]